MHTRQLTQGDRRAQPRRELPRLTALSSADRVWPAGFGRGPEDAVMAGWARSRTKTCEQRGVLPGTRGPSQVDRVTGSPPSGPIPVACVEHRASSCVALSRVHFAKRST
jgi:hypothetical protein